MQRKLISMLNKPGEIQWKLNNLNCQYHNNGKPCDIYVDTSTNNPHTIHHVNFNYIINNYDTYCIKIQSRKNKLLNYCPQLNASNKGNNYIKVDNHIVYKIGYSFITHALLLYINQLSLDTDNKMWGMFHFINLHIFYLYYT